MGNGISIHAPRTGSDPNDPVDALFPDISIHAPRTGSDARSITADIDPDNNISIHAPRTGSDMRQSAPSSSCKMISIHAPRTGSDVLLLCCCGLRRGISIHAPRTGSDLLLLSMAASMRVRFQSTLPARGATSFCRAWPGLNLDFNPRSPHGERPASARYTTSCTNFNPRSPHGERHSAAACP